MDSIVLLSYGKQRLKWLGRDARAFLFLLQRGKEKGDCGRAVHSLVALDSLVRGSRGFLEVPTDF